MLRIIRVFINSFILLILVPPLNITTKLEICSKTLIGTANLGSLKSEFILPTYHKFLGSTGKERTLPNGVCKSFNFSFLWLDHQTRKRKCLTTSTFESITDFVTIMNSMMSLQCFWSILVSLMPAPQTNKYYVLHLLPAKAHSWTFKYRNNMILMSIIHF